MSPRRDFCPRHACPAVQGNCVGAEAYGLGEGQPHQR